MKRERIHELLLQSLEVERGGARIYEAALDCVLDDDLRAEWSVYLVQTRRHAEIVTKLLEDLGLEQRDCPGSRVVRAIGEGLVNAIHLAEAQDDPEAAQIAACECVVLAETLDHLSWELISGIVDAATASDARSLKLAAGRVEDEEDEHLFHNAGWCRELWLAHLGGDPEPRPQPRRGRSPKR